MFYGHAAHFWFTLRKYSSQEKNEWGEKEKKTSFSSCVSAESQEDLTSSVDATLLQLKQHSYLCCWVRSLSAVCQNFKKP